jgi:catechol 2,3-dioxygenase-like lactoylglutathione lyase family enzyme
MNTRELVRLSGVRVAVDDPGGASVFLEQVIGFGRSDSDDAVALSCGNDYGLEARPAVLELIDGRSGLQRLTFEVGLGVDLERYSARLSASGHEVDLEDGLIRLRDPDGVEVHLTQRREVGDAELPPHPIRPRRLGHTNIKVSDPRRSFAFYSETLGLALSERIGDGMYFLRAGTEHHNLGIRGGAELADTHHVAFEIPGWESYRAICDHLAALGHTVEYGPGRHGPGNNLFLYLREPVSGLRLELFSDMAHIQDDEEYVPPVWRPEDRPRTVNRWGPAPPESFLA